SPVRRIVQTATHVDAEAETCTVRADRVIVATPPVLASHIEYDPPLPAAHEHLLRRWMPGAIIRVNTVYENPFWRPDGLNGETVAPQSPIPVSLDQSPRSGMGGILCSFSFGPPALALARLDPDQRRELWLRALVERYGAKAGTPIAYLETDWSSERWSLGGMMASFAPGVLTTYGAAVREPVGRIHWASSERATLMHGLMEGAVRSGERTADEVLACAMRAVCRGVRSSACWGRRRIGVILRAREGGPTRPPPYTIGGPPPCPVPGTIGPSVRRQKSYQSSISMFAASASTTTTRMGVSSR